MAPSLCRTPGPLLDKSAPSAALNRRKVKTYESYRKEEKNYLISAKLASQWKMLEAQTIWIVSKKPETNEKKKPQAPVNPCLGK